MTLPPPDAVLILDTDFTDLPLWLDGLLEREDISLTPATWDALASWADYFLNFYTTSYRWKASADPVWYRQEGDRLAIRVADEIGARYAVNHDGTEFRSSKGPTNETAAEDIRRLLEM
jgi:hypothetical protein